MLEKGDQDTYFDEGFSADSFNRDERQVLFLKKKRV